jgi:hypothetical protein
MFTPLRWSSRAFLTAVYLAAISPYLTISLVTSVLVLAFGVWDWRRARSRPAPAPRSVTVAGEVRVATPPPTTTLME